MNVMDSIYAKAKADPRVVVFPEYDEENILKAAEATAKEGVCKPVIVGPADEINALMDQYGVDKSVITIFDTNDEAAKEELIAEFLKTGPDMSEKAAHRKAKDVLYVALMLQKIGRADVTFAGKKYTTGDVIWAGQTIIGLKEGVTTVSSVGVAEFPNFETSEGNLLIFGDSAVCVNPDPDDLASIAAGACDTAKDLLGWEPRCAFLSYSTDGSAESELVDKVRSAVEKAQALRPEYAIDGEFQLDTAIIPKVAAKKMKRESKVAGKANIIIWPDINVGNVGVKLMQLFGGADAYGPVLNGFNKIVCDCSRSAPVSEISGNVAIAVVRAQGIK